MKHVGHNVNHPYIIQEPYQLHFDKVQKVGIASQVRSTRESFCQNIRSSFKGYG
jgi:hypothetical protein